VSYEDWGGRRIEGYVLVTAVGALISELLFGQKKEVAIRMAETVWPQINPETDDLKAFDLEENIVWLPPKEAGSKDGTG
jgi:hypothetical protein